MSQINSTSQFGRVEIFYTINKQGESGGWMGKTGRGGCGGMTQSCRGHPQDQRCAVQSLSTGICRGLQSSVTSHSEFNLLEICFFLSSQVAERIQTWD